jgi:hypothetical protein
VPSSDDVFAGEIHVDLVSVRRIHKEITMTMSRPSPLLRRALLADAIATAASGLLMTLFYGPLADLLHVPAAVLAPAGLVLLPYAALVGYLATRDPLPRAAVWAIIACNVLWAVDCVLLVTVGWVQPSSIGYTFVLAQAAVVVMFAELQYVGLRRSEVRAA